MNSEEAAEYEVPQPTLNATPLQAAVHGQIAVKVIDDRGDELTVVKSLGQGPQTSAKARK